MNVTTSGIDLAKNLFQVHGVNRRGKPVVNKQLRRDQVTAFFANMPPRLIGMEACSGAHYWARQNWSIWPQRDAGAPELSSYAARPETIEHALALQVPAEAPTAGQFRDLCGWAPAPVFRAAPEPKHCQHIASKRPRSGTGACAR